MCFFSSRVFTDIQQVLNNLTHPRFVFTDNEGEADILYNFSHFKDYRLISYRIHYFGIHLPAQPSPFTKLLFGV